MPAWLEPILSIITVTAAFFLIAWFVARDTLSRGARIVGWASVTIAAASFLWSLWAESLALYLHKGHMNAAILTMAQVLVALLALAFTVAGAVKFLRAWAAMGWVVKHGAQHFLKDSPEFQKIRETPTAAERWRMAFALIGRLLALPGLWWVPTGVGVMVLDFQYLDPEFAPDPQVVNVGIGFLAVGLVLLVWRLLVPETTSAN